MRSRSNLKPYRVRIAVDVVAPDRDSAENLARILYGLIDGRWWIKEVLADGIEERRWVEP